MRGLQDPPPARHSIRRARARQRDAFSHGNTDDAPHSSRINRPKRVVRGHSTDSRITRHSAWCVFPRGGARTIRGRHTREGTLVFNISQLVYCSDPRICFRNYIYVIEWQSRYLCNTLSGVFVARRILGNRHRNVATLPFDWSERKVFRKETSYVGPSRFGAEVKNFAAFSRSWVKSDG